MKYNGFYFWMFKSPMKKVLAEKYGREYAADIMKKSKKVYRELVEKADDIGDDSVLFRADNRTEQKTISPFSLALILTFDFAALSERRSCPEDRSRRFVLLGALDAALRQRTYPVRTVMQFSRFRCDCKTILAKNIALSRISKRSENAL